MSNNSSKIKQVIVMRKDLNMRKGKMIAQGSHASMAFITRPRLDKNSKALTGKEKYYQPFSIEGDFFSSTDHLAWKDTTIKNRGEFMQWLEEGFTKICLSVDSEEELLSLYEQAKSTGLNAELITDSGHTEFGGVPTNTCIAIGPNKSEDIDKITGHLKLL